MKKSAGILLYRVKDHAPEIFLVHPGGPFWKTKDFGSWSIPKGEVVAGDDPLATAVREFREETGCVVQGPFVPLAFVKQKGGKEVWAWAVEGNIDPRVCRSNTFLLEWPPRTGKQKEFPEVDKWEWFSAEEALLKINEGQADLIRRLRLLLGLSEPAI